MRLAELQALADEICRAKEVICAEVVWNGRLSRSRGRHVAFTFVDGHTVTVKIEVQPGMPRVVTEMVLRHELAHHIHTERTGRRSNHGPEWRAIARELGAHPRATSTDDELISFAAERRKA